MKTIRVYVRTKKIGSKCEDTFEVEDDATPEEIERMAKEVMFDMMDWGYEVK